MRSLLLVCMLATTASADVWQRALDPTSVAARDRYDALLAKGDELALRANARGQAKAKAVQLVDQAIAAYQEAADLRKDQGEPFFRIASVLDSFFVDCDEVQQAAMTSLSAIPPATCPLPGTPVDPARMQQTLDAYDAFEARSKLDPRIADALFSRAILRTKLVEGSKTPNKHLEGALADYLALIDRADGMTRVDLEGVWGNLAETYMMLGKLEPAIEAYRTAVRMGAGASTSYGLAVALDRDENYTDAAQVIRAQPMHELGRFRQQYLLRNIFYVPKGEEYYYFALIHQALGFEQEAVVYWKQYLASGAHPQFQPRARLHLAALQHKLRTNPPPRRRAEDPFDIYP